MIDLHTHILPGVDDGARGLEDSVAMARAAAAEGITAIAATPHVREDYPTSADTMEALVSEVAQALVAEGVNVEILRGGEIALDRLSMLTDNELRRFGLGGNPRYLLLEFPYVGWPLDLSARISQLRRKGFTAVLAHPERNREVQLAPDRLAEPVRQGALVQVTAASVDGRLGRRVAGNARDLIRVGFAHMIASDAHQPEVRAIGMSSVAKAVGGSTVARWLTHDVPDAIVADAPIPPRPERERRRLSLLRR